MFSFGRRFNRYQLSLTLGLLATYCIRFGLSWWTLEATGSTVAFASLMAVSTLIEVYARPVLSPMGDYFNRGRLVSGSYLLTAFFALATSIIAASGFFNIYLLYILLIGIGLVAAVRDPASAGLIPELVEASKLTKAYASRATVASTANIIAPMAAAAILSVGGWRLDLYIGVISSSAAALCAVKLGASGAQESGAILEYLRIWHVKIAEGLRATVLVKTEFQLALVAAVLNFSLYPFFFVVLPIWITSDLALSKGYIGIVEGAFAFGMALSGWIAATFLVKRISAFTRLFVGALLLGSGVALAGVVGEKYAILAALLLAGIGFTLFNVATGSLRAAATPNEYRSRLYAGVSFVSCCANPLAVLLAGILLEFMKPGYVVFMYGVMMIVAALLLPLITKLRAIMNMNTDVHHGLYRSIYPNAFGHK